VVLQYKAAMNASTHLNSVALVIEVLLLVGLTVRGRWRLCVCFGAYTGWALVRSILMEYWPERFFFQWFWLIGQSILDTLKLGIALEIGWRMFAEFPGAKSVARKATVLILGLTAVAVASLPLASPPMTSFQTAITNFHPRLNDGTIWLIAAFLATARWYRVPVHRFHAGLLISLALYLVFFSSIFQLFVGRDFEGARHYVVLLDNSGFLLAICWWMHITWRADNATDRAHMGTLSTLHHVGTDRRDGLAARVSGSPITPQRRLA